MVSEIAHRDTYIPCSLNLQGHDVIHFPSASLKAVVTIYARSRSTVVGIATRLRAGRSGVRESIKSGNKKKSA